LDRGFKSSIKEDLVDGIGAHLFIARGGCPMDAASIIAQGGISPIYIPEDVYDKIKNIKSIKHIMPFKIFSITTSDGMRTDIFTGLTKEVEAMKSKWKYKEGGWFTSDNSVILGADIAAIEKRQIGDKIYVEHFDREFEVVGILEYAYNQDDGMFFLPLKTAQKLINREGKLSAIAVGIHDINNLSMVKAEIKSHLADDYLVLTPEAIGNNVMSFFNSTRTIMFAVLFFTLIVSTVGIANTILIGLSAGVILSSLFEGYVREFLLTSYISSTADIIRPGMDIAVITYLIIIVIGLLAATFPAVKISKIMPMEAIRNE
jgi:ABC-type lipoprotein release transport system permease subunit